MSQQEKDQEIPTKSEEAYHAATTPHIKLPRTNTLDDNRPPPPFPQRLKKQKQEYQFKKFMDILKQIHINLSLVDALQQMTNYVKFLKEMMSRKIRIGGLKLLPPPKHARP
ncbi:hypothetical protein GQ457_01G032020 [Hibiscus cannabinus]